MIGAMATASTPPLVRVLRAAASHIRCLPDWSVHSIFFNSHHFASSDLRGMIRSTLGVCDDAIMPDENCLTYKNGARKENLLLIINIDEYSRFHMAVLDTVIHLSCTCVSHADDAMSKKGRCGEMGINTRSNYTPRFTRHTIETNGFKPLISNWYKPMETKYLIQLQHVCAKLPLKVQEINLHGQKITIVSQSSQQKMKPRY